MNEFRFLTSRHPLLSPRLLVIQGAVFGAGMVVLGWLIAAVIRGRDVSAWFPRPAWASDLLLGGLVGAVFALGIWGLLDAVPPLKRMQALLTHLLDMDVMRPHHALLLGLVAGIPEEILFRGAIQPLAGVVGTSLLFGLLHAVTPAYFVYASGAGLLLGGLAIWRGSLWAPIAAHVVIDTVMLLLLLRAWRRSQPKKASVGHDGS
jgi:uncharacterized protein